jgi:hypothetical protein
VRRSAFFHDTHLNLEPLHSTFSRVRVSEPCAFSSAGHHQVQQASVLASAPGEKCKLNTHRDSVFLFLQTLHAIEACASLRPSRLLSRCMRLMPYLCTFPDSGRKPSRNERTSPVVRNPSQRNEIALRSGPTASLQKVTGSSRPSTALPLHR